MSFQALLVREQEGCRLETLEPGSLPDGDVLVQVSHSTINYKDALAVTGKGKVIRKFPMVPGIDLAGKVLESESAEYPPGTEILCTGQGLGELHWGGYGQLARLRADMLNRLPAGMSLEHSMALGTAGFTAMLAVMALEEHGVEPFKRPVLVTGATGGVGSVAVALLRKRGFPVTAVTGRPALGDYLRELGATEIMERAAFDRASKPMESETWGGAVDTVGGAILGTAFSQVVRHGTVAVCGLASSAKLESTVFPFILRGVTMAGIDSVMCPPERRRRAWNRLAADLPASVLERMITRVSLEQVPETADRLLSGRVHGRVVVNVG